MAEFTVSFDAWKEGKVGATKHQVAILLPKRPDIKLEPVSSRLVRELIHPNKTSEPMGIRFAPDGKRVLAGVYPGGIVALWDVQSGKRLTTIETGDGWFFPTPDWKTLYANQRGKVKRENIEQSGKRLRRWEFDGAVRSWNLSTGEPQKTVQHAPPRYIHSMQLSSDGNRFITHDKLAGIYEFQPTVIVSVWDVRSGKYFDLSGNFDEGRLSPNGALYVAIAVDKDQYATALKLFDTATGKEKLHIPVKDHNARVSISAFSSDSKLMLVGYQVFGENPKRDSWQYRLDVLESDTCRVVASLDGKPNDHLHGYFAPDGHTIGVLQSWSKEKKVILFNIPEQRVFKTIILNNPNKGEHADTGAPIFSPCGNSLAIISRVMPESLNTREADALDLPQPRIHLIEVATGAIRQTLVAPQCYRFHACFSPDGRMLATSGRGRVLLWDVSK